MLLISPHLYRSQSVLEKPKDASLVSANNHRSLILLPRITIHILDEVPLCVAFVKLMVITLQVLINLK